MSAIVTPTERLVRIVENAGGSIDRAKAMRLVAPALGIRGTRLAVGLAIATRQLALTHDDRLEVIE